MAVYEHDGLLSYIDESGNTHILYPVTKLGNVDGTDGTVLPSGGVAGQVLTMGSDGNPVWADSTGGTAVPSAEGVEF